MGLALLRLIHVPWLRLQARPRPVSSFGGAYALGLPFGLSTCPACTPMVLPVLGAAATGEAWIGAALLFTFGVTRGIPLVIAAALTGAALQLRRVAVWVPRIERAGGVLLLLAALYFLYQSAAATGAVPPLQFVRPEPGVALAGCRKAARHGDRYVPRAHLTLPPPYSIVSLIESAEPSNARRHSPRSTDPDGSDRFPCVAGQTLR